jgi:hypothetical protein
MPFFFAHIEFGANYETLRDLLDKVATGSLKQRLWESGYEMLANAATPECNRGLFGGKKAATLADLVMKVSCCMLEYIGATC